MEQELKRRLEELIEASRLTMAPFTISWEDLNKPKKLVEEIVDFVLNGKKKGSDGQ